MVVMVTGAAGFVGRAVCERLLARGEAVVGVDDFTLYYDPALKLARAADLKARPGFRMVRLDVADAPAFAALLRDTGAKRVVHLAAQAGVRYSLENPFAYEHSNLAGHLSVLEACRAVAGFEHLVYASSSSVYGDRPLEGEAFGEDDPAVSPVSLYAATKRAGELMSGAYAHLYGLRQTGLRFFTVYGPWGRPDMAYYEFTRRMLAGETIEVYGEGRMARDFTYIDDITAGVVAALDRPPATGARVLNIGGGRPVPLMDMISTLERVLGVEALKVMRPMQPGDVTTTRADVTRLQALTGAIPQVELAEGLAIFARWYRTYHAVE